jgi:hypothetical protein
LLLSHFHNILPDKRTHRGPHPDDARLFAPDQWPRLRDAVRDLSWLMGRGYASVSALKIVGDHYQLDQRQRNAVSRWSCSDAARDRREQSRVDLARLAGQTLLIDGYNVLTSIEAALAGGVILSARDGCFRDLASIHGTWRKVAETLPAVELLGRFLEPWQLKNAAWYLDSPVSNSGRLKTMLRQIATAHGWPWEIELVPDPDRVLSDTSELIATADSAILDRCQHWVNLARSAIEQFVPDARVIVCE